MIELNSLAMQSLDIAEKRNRNGAKLNTDTVSMLKHCATEIVETTEAYCRNKEDFISELSDIICCVLIIAGHEKIDIELAIKKCVEKNAKRNPILDEQIGLIDQALNRTTLNKNIKTYRTITANKEALSNILNIPGLDKIEDVEIQEYINERLKKGNIRAHDNAYLSTTIDRDYKHKKRNQIRNTISDKRTKRGPRIIHRKHNSISKAE